MGTIWKNWSETLVFQPDEIFYPESKEEIQELILQANEQGKSIRVIGSGHSFTPLIESQLLVSLDNYQGIVSIDSEQDRVTVRSGTKLKVLGELLFEKGYMMENLGDIDVQSIAGAISTGTHGTGMEFGIISTQLFGMEYINGKGEIISCSEQENEEIFRAAQVAFGTLGIITELTVKVVPAYKLHYRGSKTSLDDVLDNLSVRVEENRNFEFYWFPYSEHIQLKETNITTEEIKDGKISSWFNDSFMENFMFGIICRAVRLFPRTASFFSRIAGATISDRDKINWGHKVYATIRKVKFVEMEYSVPFDHCGKVIKEIKAFIENEKIRVNFPIEVRFVKQDNIILSPAYGSDRCFIAVHMYKGMPYDKYLRGCEKIFLSHQGRPHWGKIHYLRKDELKDKYPMFERFNAIRADMDPDSIFLNQHTRSLFE